jgi:hypothetical protein
MINTQNEQCMTTQTLGDPATRAYRTVNPSTGVVEREYPPLDDRAAEALLTLAHNAYLERQTC